jgi:hypothetical protein
VDFDNLTVPLCQCPVMLTLEGPGIS